MTFAIYIRRYPLRGFQRTRVLYRRARKASNFRCSAVTAKFKTKVGKAILYLRYTKKLNGKEIFRGAKYETPGWKLEEGRKKKSPFLFAGNWRRFPGCSGTLRRKRLEFMEEANSRPGFSRGPTTHLKVFSGPSGGRDSFFFFFFPFLYGCGKKAR